MDSITYIIGKMRKPRICKFGDFRLCTYTNNGVNGEVSITKKYECDCQVIISPQQIHCFAKVAFSDVDAFKITNLHIPGFSMAPTIHRMSILKVGYRNLTWYRPFLIISAYQFDLRKKCWE